MDSKAEKDHPVSLKVMRLTKPTFFTDVSVACEPQDLAGDILSCDNSISISDVGIGQYLLLPQSFGSIYLGETFTCCICLHNDSTDTVSNVTIKAVLQISALRLSLLDDEDDCISQLKPDDLINKIIRHEIKEIGTHILVCSVTYESEQGEQNFRKFFRFEVMKPLDVKTKFYNAESDEVYLEAGIQNITVGPIFLEKVGLDPASCYAVTPLNSVIGSDHESIFGRNDCVHPNDVQQYLFCLRPSEEAIKNPSMLRQCTNIGKLDIVWRTSLGDGGRLQASQLQKNLISQYGDIKIVIKDIPSIVNLEEPFDILFGITNTCERDLSLHVDFLNGESGTEWHLVTSRTIEEIKVGESMCLNFSQMALRLGLQAIAGLRITDNATKRTNEYDNLAHVYVSNEMSKERLDHFNQWITQSG